MVNKNESIRDLSLWITSDWSEYLLHFKIKLPYLILSHVVCFIFSNVFPQFCHARQALFYRTLRFNKHLPYNKTYIFLHRHVKRIVVMNIAYLVTRSNLFCLRLEHILSLCISNLFWLEVGTYFITLYIKFILVWGRKTFYHSVYQTYFGLR